MCGDLVEAAAVEGVHVEEYARHADDLVSDTIIRRRRRMHLPCSAAKVSTQSEILLDAVAQGIMRCSMKCYFGVSRLNEAAVAFPARGAARRAFRYA